MASPLLDFSGKVIIVTGAARGLGREYARLLAARQAAVVVCDIADGMSAETSATRQLVAELEESGGRAVAVDASVASRAGARAIVDTAIEAFGRIDGLINNAGILSVAPFDTLSEATFRQFIDVHLMGTIFVSQAAWPHLCRSGEGRIVNIVSNALLGARHMSHYAAAKGAVLGLTRSLALEGAAFGLGINAMAPAANTRMLDTPGIADCYPPGRIEQAKLGLRPSQIAPVAAFLLHPNCKLTGEVLNARGGRVSRWIMGASAGIDTDTLTPEIINDRLSEIME